MEGASLSPTARAIAWWLVPVLASCAMFTVVTRGRVDLRTDGLYYLSCAETLTHRHELGASVYFSERIARASNGERIDGLRRWPRQPAEPGEVDGRLPEVAPFTAWPPGFPVFLAAFLGVLSSSAAAAFGAMLASYALLALGAALLGRELGGASFALVSALAVVASPYLFDAGTCNLGSDVLCAALLLMALAALVRWTREPSVHALVATTICAIAAGYVRYLALLAVPVVVALVAVAVLRGTLVGSAARRQLAIAVVPAPLAMAPLLLHNLHLTGFLFGTERLPSDRALLGNLEDVARTTLRALPLSFDAVPGKLDVAVSGAITLLFVVLVATRVRSERALAFEPTERRALLPVMLFGAVYVAALVIVRTRTLADELEARLLLPALVSLTIAGLLVGARMVRPNARIRVGAALVALLAAATLSEVPAQQARVAARAERAEARAVELRSLLGNGTARGAPALLFSDRAFEVSAAIGGTVHWLPAPSRVPSIEAHSQGRPIAFVLQRSSSFFPCGAMEAAYEEWLARSARATKRAETFEVYWLASGGTAPSAVEEACDGSAREVHASPSVWVIDDGEKIRRDATETPFERGEHNPVWSPGQPVRLFAMRNESVTLQVVVEANADPLASVTVDLPRLDGPDGSVIAGTSSSGDAPSFPRPIERFVEHFVDVRRASTGARDTVAWVGPVPDALIPIDSAPAWDTFPMRVEPRTNGIVWIDVNVPRPVAPGTYRGTIDVRDGGRALAEVPVELEVADPVLPDRMSGAMIYYDAHNVARRTGSAASEQSLWMVLHEHRIAALHDATTAADVVRQIHALDGSLYTRARGYLGPAQGVGDGVLSFGAYGDLGDPRDESVDAVEQMAHAAGDAKLWEGTDVFLYAIDERCDSPRAGAWRALLRSSNDTTLRRVRVAQTCSRDPAAQAVDVAMLNASWDEDRVRAARTLGKDVWVYDGAEPHTGTFRLDADAISPRVNGWLAAMFGIPRWFFWEATYWYGRHDAHPIDPFVEAETFRDDDGDFENGGGVLVYPGEQVDAFQEHSLGVAGVIPSIRLKNWRRGVEDGAYLEMARARDAKKADAVSAWLIPAAFGSSDDDDAPSWGARGDRFFQARRALLAIVKGRDPEPLGGAVAPAWVARSEARARWRLGW